MTPAISAQYKTFQDDFSKVNLQGKQANSGTGIDPDFGVTYAQTKSLLNSMLDTDSAKAGFKSNDPIS